MSKNVNIDICRLGVGHALILSNLPKAVQLAQLNKILQVESKADLVSFGLFESSSPNYTTYYPEVTAADLVPKEEEFINPVFRALSQVIVHKKFNPIDFSNGDVLNSSMNLLKGQTVNVDHETMTGNAIGAVSEVSWEDSYELGGIRVPPGINTVLHIDGKSNPRIARGINANPPSIHSTSVTVEFEWEQSHTKLTRDEFFNKLGTFDEHGEMIRRVVTKVKRYHEISLVNHGADPYAQLIKKDGKINNPQYAHISYNNNSELSVGASSFFMDFKNLWDSGVSDIVANSQGLPTIPDIPIINIQNQENMKELVILLAATLKVPLAFTETGELTEENSTALTDALSTVLSEAEAEKNAHAQTKAQLATANANAGPELTELSQFKQATITALRDKVINTYKLSVGTKVDPTLLESLAGMQDFNALTTMLKTYEASLEEKAPLKCTKCGSSSVSRASASINSDGGEGNFSDIGDEETTTKLMGKPKLPTYMHT